MTRSHISQVSNFNPAIFHAHLFYLKGVEKRIAVSARDLFPFDYYSIAFGLEKQEKFFCLLARKEVLRRLRGSLKEFNFKNFSVFSWTDLRNLRRSARCAIYCGRIL